MFNISAINVNITTIATDGFALQGLFLNRNSNCKMSIEEVISLNLLSNSPLEWNVVTEKVGCDGIRNEQNASHSSESFHLGWGFEKKVVRLSF